MNSQTNRLIVVNALSGFAIASLLLLHNIELFDFYYHAEKIPVWMKIIDNEI